MSLLLLPVAEAVRQQAGHRRGRQEAVVCALRHAQDVDSVQNHRPGDQASQDHHEEVCEEIDPEPKQAVTT